MKTVCDKVGVPSVCSVLCGYVARMNGICLSSQEARKFDPLPGLLHDVVCYVHWPTIHVV